MSIQPSGVPRHDAPKPWPALFLAVLAVLAYAGTSVYVLGTAGLPLDDSWIHLDFAQQLAAGEGLRHGSGSLLPASTAPLWTALLALFMVLPGSPVPWVWALGTALLVTTVLATDRLAERLGCTLSGRRLATLLVASTHWMVWSALSGMEVLLMTSLSLAGLAAHLEERRDPQRTCRSLVLFAAATLARPEAYLLFVLAVVDRVLHIEPSSRGAARLRFERPGKPWWLALLASSFLLLPTLAFSYSTGGSILPTTYAVKGGGAPDLFPDGRYLRTVLDIFASSQPLMLLLAGAGALRLLARTGGPRDRGLLPLLWLAGLPLAYSMLTPEGGPLAVGNFGRYYFPLVPVLTVLGVFGIEPLLRRMPRTLRWGRLPLPIAGILFTALLLPSFWGLFVGPLRYTQTVANVEDSDVAAARWLAEHLHPEALVASQDIGALGYFLPNAMIDLAGLVNPEILPVLRGVGDGPEPPGAWEVRLLAYLEEQRPDFLVIFPRSYPRLTSTAGMTPVRRFAVADNVTMAGDELVIFATPWCRFPLGETHP